MLKAVFICVATGAAASLAGCANSDSKATSLNIVPAAGPEEPGAAPQPHGLGLSAEEQEFDCKKLTGRMQIRILEARTFANSKQSSNISQSMHSASKSVFGGSAAGLAPQGRYAGDLQKLEAYNRELAAKDCKSYDLQQALAGTDLPPVPTVEAPSKKRNAWAPKTN